AGTAIGFNVGRRLSDAEAHAATAGVEAAALLSLSAAMLSGASSRGEAAAVAAGLVAGAPIGLRYPRRASYTVTAGDVDAVGTAGLIGAVLGASVLPKDADDKPIAAVLGVSYAGGLLL